MKAALKLVKLREENNFRQEKIAGAYWIYGSHCLYTERNYTKALEMYKNAIELLDGTMTEDTYHVIASALEGIGRVILLFGDKDGERDIQEVISIYKDYGDKYNENEAKWFLESLQQKEREK